MSMGVLLTQMTLNALELSHLEMIMAREPLAMTSGPIIYYVVQVSGWLPFTFNSYPIHLVYVTIRKMDPF